MGGWRVQEVGLMGSAEVHPEAMVSELVGMFLSVRDDTHGVLRLSTQL